jgi:uncharacterized Zn finger protein (UPF0148 family)
MSTTFNCPSCKTKNVRKGPEVGCAACGFGHSANEQHTHETQPTPSEPRREEAVPPPQGFTGKYLTETL